MNDPKMCISSHHPPHLRSRHYTFNPQTLPQINPRSRPAFVPSPASSGLNVSIKSKFGVTRPHSDIPFLNWYRDNQIEIPLVILTLLVGGYTLPPTQSIFLNILFPAYPVSHKLTSNCTSPGYAASTFYDKGIWDLAFVTYGVVLWTLLRSITIAKFLRPLAARFHCSGSYLDRFGEQGWLALYYSISWSIGIYFATLSPWWNNTDYFWIDYPHVYLTGEFKAYYLLQLAFWVQQLLVIHIEKRRKDHLQMLVHHVVTCTLLVSSYYCNFTRIGAAILVTMDVGDIFLSTAKCLNYLRFRTLCDVVFALFFGVWIFSRHVVYNVILVAVWFDVHGYIEMMWDPSVGHYLTWSCWAAFWALLALLQVLLIAWFVMILRVVFKVIRGAPAEDNRSDDESDSEALNKLANARGVKS